MNYIVLVAGPGDVHDITKLFRAGQDGSVPGNVDVHDKTKIFRIAEWLGEAPPAWAQPAIPQPADYRANLDTTIDTFVAKYGKESHAAGLLRHVHAQLRNHYVVMVKHLETGQHPRLSSLRYPKHDPVEVGPTIK